MYGFQALTQSVSYSNKMGTRIRHRPVTKKEITRMNKCYLKPIELARVEGTLTLIKLTVSRSGLPMEKKSYTDRLIY